ncbi:MATE family efflux transporter, partial [Brevundimonas sp.]|uniref:MATE family efflux transporter n=1 Tax=Brevundimonas sp. TaxID=1871086 RepID=UPI0025C64E19
MTVLSPQTRATLKDLLNLAWPVVLARIGIMTMGLTDAIVVGNYASRELAFHSLAWAPHSIIVVTAVGLLFGVQVMTARMLGEGRRAEVGAVLRRGLVYALQLGVAACIALVFLGPLLLRQLNLEAGLAE